MRTIILSALAAASLVTFAAPASAEPTRHVRYGDLDLTTPGGRHMLHQRVSTAVIQVCGRAEERDVHSGKAIDACRDDTWAATRPQLNAVLGASVRVLADARMSITKARPRG